MFLNQKILSKLMKEACKGGLTVARKEDWIHLAGRGWKTTIKESHMPNKTKGDIVALLGKLPTSGECYTVTTKEIEEEEFCWPQVEGEMEKLHVTRVILDGLLSEMQRVLQFEDGKIVTVNNMFVDIVDNISIDEKNVEYSADGPFDAGTEVYWENNVCIFWASKCMVCKNNEENIHQLSGLKLFWDVSEQ